MARRHLRFERKGLRFDAGALLSGFLLYELNNLALKPLAMPGVAGIFLGGHLNDVVCGMAFMAYTNLLFDLVRPRLRQERLAVIAPYILACGLFWEYVAPLLLKPSTSDPWDVLCYVLGGSLYWLANRLWRGLGKARAGEAAAR